MGYESCRINVFRRTKTMLVSLPRSYRTDWNWKFINRTSSFFNLIAINEQPPVFWIAVVGCTTEDSRTANLWNEWNVHRKMIHTFFRSKVPHICYALQNSCLPIASCSLIWCRLVRWQLIAWKILGSSGSNQNEQDVSLSAECSANLVSFFRF